MHLHVMTWLDLPDHSLVAITEMLLLYVKDRSVLAKARKGEWPTILNKLLYERFRGRAQQTANPQAFRALTNFAQALAADAADVSCIRTIICLPPGGRPALAADCRRCPPSEFPAFVAAHPGDRLEIIEVLAGADAAPLLAANWATVVSWLNAEDIEVRHRAAELVQAHGAGAVSALWEALAAAVTPEFLRAFLAVAREQRLPRGQPPDSVARQPECLERDAVLTYFGATEPLAAAAERLPRSLAEFCALAEAAEALGPALESEPFRALVASADPGQAAALLAAAGPLLPPAVAQRLLIGDESPGHLRHTAPCAAGVALDAGALEALHRAVGAALPAAGAEALAGLLRAMAACPASAGEIGDLDAEPFAQFLAQAGDVGDVTEYVTVLARRKPVFAAAVAARLRGTEAVVTAVRIALVRVASDEERIGEIVGIAEGLDGAKWPGFLRSLCEETQRLEDPWVPLVWQRLLTIAPEAALEAGREPFQEMLRAIDGRGDRRGREDFARMIAGAVANRSPAAEKRAALLARAWTWAKQILQSQGK
jgi:hypothetical protein